MGKIIINGGKRLTGDIDVSGSKNAVLPILVATVLNAGQSIIKNCPKIKDVIHILDILQEIGCDIKWEGNKVTVNSENISTTVMPEDLVREMRSSIIFLGPMLAKFGEVTISYPGGCKNKL